MSKVLVDRELLEHLAEMGDEAIQRMGSYLAEKHGEQRYVDAARAILAQPAEAEGVEVVGYAVTWIRAGDTPEKTAFMSAADFEATGGPRFYSYREPLMTVAQHIAALSAVTAERDAANSRLHEVAVACAEAEAERDQLRAEVETLRKVIRAALYYVPEHKHDLREIMSAAMAAKEA